jgi:hypothetical protein
MKRIKLGFTAIALMAGIVSVAAANVHKFVVTTYDIVNGPNDVPAANLSTYCGDQSSDNCAFQKHDGVATGVVIKAVRLN